MFIREAPVAGQLLNRYGFASTLFSIQEGAPDLSAFRRIAHSFNEELTISSEGEGWVHASDIWAYGVIDRVGRYLIDLYTKQIGEEVFNTVHNISGRFREEGVVLPYEESEDPVLQKLEQLFSRFLNLYRALKSSNNSIAVVFNPDFLSLKESERIVTGLQDLELPLRAGFNNKCNDSLQETAQEVEKTLFSKRPDLVLTRVPEQRNNRVGSYKIDLDLTAAFV